MKDHVISKAGIIILLFSLSLSSCIDLNDINDVELFYQDAEYALPLVNSKLTLESVLAENVENSGISYDEEGLAIVSYESDLIRKQAYEVFKPIVFPGPLAFTDSVEQVRFDQIDNYVVEKGTIRGDSLRFGFTSNFDQAISIGVGIKEAKKDGDPFYHEIMLPAGETIVSPLYSLRGYDFNSPENLLSFYYDARLPDGERVLLEDAYFEFTYFVFDFVQGFLGKNTQKLNDHQIRVNIFELWESGLLEFDDPRVKIRLDNSFGFPVKAVINHFEITNLAGEVVPLESSLFDEDIIFDYPSLDEIGEVKSSEFIFDKNNSNFATAFNQKVTQLSYDVDALANPANDPSLIGFFTFDSYYLLNVSVELPMRFKADEFQLADEFPIDSITIDLDLVDSFELKTYVTNLFPVDVHAQIYLMNEDKELIDSLFTEGERLFAAATIQTDGSIIPDIEQLNPFYFNYGSERKQILEQTRRILPRIRLSTTNNQEEWTSITKDQGLDVKIGVKLKLKGSL